MYYGRPFCRRRVVIPRDTHPSRNIGVPYLPVWSPRLRAVAEGGGAGANLGRMKPAGSPPLPPCGL
jgi:hypothetical protein